MPMPRNYHKVLSLNPVKEYFCIWLNSQKNKREVVQQTAFDLWPLNILTFEARPKAFVFEFDCDKVNCQGRTKMQSVQPRNV